MSHLAIDWVSLNWYLVDRDRETLYVCERTLRVCRILLDSELSKAHGLALDPAEGLMFWTAWGATPPTVGRATLAGEERRQLIKRKLVYPEALTLDLPARVVYWVDLYLDCVERVNYDGSNRLSVRRRYHVSHDRGTSTLTEEPYVSYITVIVPRQTTVILNVLYIFVTAF